ncbi:hypothetical protein DsansV1_C01g0008201 [Dioscorea sansibarensis]
MIEFLTFFTVSLIRLGLRAAAILFSLIGVLATILSSPLSCPKK